MARRKDLVKNYADEYKIEIATIKRGGHANHYVKLEHKVTGITSTASHWDVKWAIEYLDHFTQEKIKNTQNK